MKKLVALVLALTMLLALAACSASSSPAKTDSQPTQEAAPAAEPAKEASTEEAPAAATWTPEKEIRLIICYKAGGQSDLIARKLASIIESNHFLDTNIVIVNISDGNTNDGIAALQEADPDGYTLMFHHNAFITLNTTGTIAASYNDVSFVCETVEQPFLICAGAQSKFNCAQDIIDAANGGEEVQIGFAGFSSPGHFALLNFLYQTGIQDKVKQVIYTGGSEAITAQLGGQIDLRSSNTADAFAYIASGDIKPVVFMSDVPHASYPDVGTTADLGYTGALTLRSGLFAPAGTPQEILDAISAAVEQACSTQEWLDFCQEQGATPSYATAEEFKAKFDMDQETITTLVEVFADQFDK